MIKHRIGLILAFVFLFFLNLIGQTEMPIKNHVLIIDYTGSMTGRTGGADIWGKVKETIVNYIGQVESNDKITLIWYATDFESHTYAGSEKEDAKLFVNDLEANGQNTCTYKTVENVFENGNILDANDINIIQLYTDGTNSTRTCGSEYTATSSITKYGFEKGKYDFLFYITLGFEAPEDLKNIISSTNNAEIIEAGRGKIPYINIISPKALSLEFSRDRMSLNQGFYVYSSKDISSNYKVKVDPVNVNIDGCSRTENEPSFKNEEYAVNEDEKIELKLMNGIDNLDEGTFHGRYNYSHDVKSYTYVIPNEVELILSNIPASEVTITFKKLLNR